MRDLEKEGARGSLAFALGVHLAETADAAPDTFRKAGSAADAGPAFRRRSDQ